MSTPRDRILEQLDKLDPYQASAHTMRTAVVVIKEELAKLDVPPDPETIPPSAVEEFRATLTGIQQQLEYLTADVRSLKSGRKAAA